MKAIKLTFNKDYKDCTTSVDFGDKPGKYKKVSSDEFEYFKLFIRSTILLRACFFAFFF